MASLKEIKRRIEAVKGTQKVTRAMQLVSAAKLKRVQNLALEGRAYASEIHDAVKRVSRRLGNRSPGLWRRPTSLDVIDLVVITSNRGLCGGFNENLLHTAEYGVQDLLTHNIDIRIFTIGKKGTQYFKRLGYDVEELDVSGDREKSIASIVDMICSRYISKRSSGCNLAFNRFISAAKQRMTFWNLIPLYHIGDESERHIEYSYEPERMDALDALGRESLISAFRQAMLESEAAEVAARMSAMDGATKNADDMIVHLTSVYNRARQEEITSELIDIVNGAEALR